MADLSAEIRAREIFREALYLHYIDGLTCGEAVAKWLRTHGGWFRDNQEVYDPDDETSEDHDENVRSPHPSIAVEEAQLVMATLFAILSTEISREERDRILRGGSWSVDPFKLALAGKAREWLEDVMGLPPVAAEE
jgi:hypothetical protein